MKSVDKSEQHTWRMAAVWNEVADGWHRWSEHIWAWTKDSTLKMMEEAEISEGSRVLDVAAGDGVQSFMAAEIVGSEGHVLCTDISENLLKFAKQAAEEKGYSQMRTELMPAENLKIEDETFDAVICRNGLMLFADQHKAVSEFHRVLKPGGKFSALVFSTPQSNPLLAIPGKLILEAAEVPPPKPGEPGLFSLSQPQVIEDLLEGCGFTEISVSKAAETIEVPEKVDLMDFITKAAGELVAVLSQMTEEQKTEVLNRIKMAFEQFKNDQGHTLPSEFLVLSGRKPNE